MITGTPDIEKETLYAKAAASRCFDLLEELIGPNPYLTSLATSGANVGNAGPDDREQLRMKLQLLLEAAKDASDPVGFGENGSQAVERYETLLHRNIRESLSASKRLEIAYRGLDIFFANNQSKPDNLIFLSAEMEQLSDLDNTRFMDAVRTFLMDNFDRLDLRSNISLVVMPGHLDSFRAMEKWSKIVSENKAILITDFRDLEHPEEVHDLFSEALYAGVDPFRRNVVMTCNYLCARRRYEQWGEPEDLYVPGSTALAAGICNFPVHRLLSGRTHDALTGVESVRFDIKISDLVHLEKLGLVTFINKSGKVLPYSVRTLYTGRDDGFKLFSVTRLFDHMSKVLIDLANRTAFESWTSRTQQDMVTRIMRFLNNLQGHEMLIRDFRLARFDRGQDLRLYLDIQCHLQGGHEYLFSMEALMGYGSYDWKVAYNEL